MFGSRLRGRLKAFVEARPAPRVVDPDDLTDAELIALSKAAQHPGGRVPDLACMASDNGVAALHRLQQLGLIEREAPGDNPTSSPAYKITATGLVAIGVVDVAPIARQGLADASPSVPIPDPLPLKATPANCDASGAGWSGHQGSPAAGQLAEPPKTAADAKPAAKIAQLVDLLRSDGGAGLADLRTLTGWQPHTIRAAISRLRKAGFAITSERSGGTGTVYHLIETSPKSAGQPDRLQETIDGIDRFQRLASGPGRLSSSTPVEPLAGSDGEPPSGNQGDFPEGR